MADKVGLCKCGCGRPTKIAERNRKELGWVKGQPVPTLMGHGGCHRRAESRLAVIDGDGCRTIPLTSGKEAVVDAADYESLSRFLWYCVPCGYAARTDNSNHDTIFMHRVILGLGDDDLITDHINGNKLDNRRRNLRRCTIQQNNYNQRKPINNRSGVKGVFWDTTRGKWCAQIRANGHGKHLGFFPDIEGATAARRAAEIKYHGEFARSV